MHGVVSPGTIIHHTTAVCASVSVRHPPDAQIGSFHKTAIFRGDLGAHTGVVNKTCFDGVNCVYGVAVLSIAKGGVLNL